MTGRYYADAGPGEIHIYAETAHTNDHGPDTTIGGQRIRAPDHGSPDDELRAYGWHRITQWIRTADMPTGHRVAAVEPYADTALAQLAKDQRIGDERRARQAQEER